MKITVLDGYCAQSRRPVLGGIAAARRPGGVRPHLADEVVQRAAGAAIVFTNKTPLPDYVLRQLPELRYIGVLATGYNIVDVEAAQQRGIVVTNIPTYGTASVAQFVFALLLELCHNVKLHADAVRAGEWSRSPDWSFWKSPLVELAGKTMGIVGFGRIGRRWAASPTRWECASSPATHITATRRPIPASAGRTLEEVLRGIRRGEPACAAVPRNARHDRRAARWR